MPMPMTTAQAPICGRKAGGAKGSGFLSVENDDQTAERQCGFFEETGLDATDVLPWNAHPWYRHGTANLRTHDLRRGVEPLKNVMALMPDIRAIVLFGNNAQKSWKYFQQKHPEIALKIRGIDSPHPGTQALWSTDAQVRERRVQRRTEAMREAREVLN
jgi:hypothetical protein